MPESQISDSALMGALKQDDTRALTSLIDRWEPRLLHFVYRYVQNQSVARDLVQETFVRVYQARKRYDEKRAFSTWMFGIAANLCRNHYRWLSRHAEADLDSAPEPVDNSTPADQFRASEQSREIARLIQQLPHGLRVALLLYYYDDLSYEEIAGVVGCSVRGVESRLYRARKFLASRLGLDRLEESRELPKARQTPSKLLI
jgi:RNA polymerase sigma-70 factor (ECF subfamily)